MLEKLKSLTEKKVYGVPIVYIGLLLGAGLLWWAIRTPRSEPAETASDSEPDGEAGDYYGGGEQPIFTADPIAGGGSGSIGDTTGDGVVDAPTYESNGEWGRAATSYLTTLGYSASEVSRAINTYLYGGTLSWSEDRMIAAAVAKLGIPPELTEPSKSETYTGPASRQGTPPLTHVVKGDSDNTAAELALLYYGANNAASINLIKSATGPGATVNNRDVYTPGDAIQIPASQAATYDPATGIPSVKAPEKVIGNPSDLVNVKAPSGNIAEIPKSYAGTPSIKMGVKANEKLADFQKRQYDTYGFVTSFAELQRLNPNKPDTLDNMRGKGIHAANTLVIKAAG